MSHISSKLKAPKLGYAEHTFQHGDPKELFIAINELALISQSRQKMGFRRVIA